MTMTYLWTGMLFVSVFFALCNGTSAQVSTASLEGATAAVDLCISMTGTICLWTGFMEVLRQCGLSEKLARAMYPLLKKLYPDVAQDPKVLGDIAANLSANLLGLGNAATPLGLEAAKGLSRKTAEKGVASPSLCLFIVCNTASLQVLPTTVASLRTATGSENPMEILPAVWLSSTLSVITGIFLCSRLEKIWHKKEMKLKQGGDT